MADPAPFLRDLAPTDLIRVADLLQRTQKALRDQRRVGHVESDRGAAQAMKSFEKVEAVLRRLATAMPRRVG